MAKKPNGLVSLRNLPPLAWQGELNNPLAKTQSPPRKRLTMNKNEITATFNRFKNQQ